MEFWETRAFPRPEFNVPGKMPGYVCGKFILQSSGPTKMQQCNIDHLWTKNSERHTRWTVGLLFQLFGRQRSLYCLSLELR